MQKKTLSAILMLTMILALSACDNKEVALPTDTASESEELTETAESEPESSKELVNVNLNLPYPYIELDGNEEDSVITTEFCCFESDKYVLFMDKGLCIPGNMGVVLDAVIDDIEDRLNLSYKPEGFTQSPDNSLSSYFGFNPCVNDLNGKIPIAIVVDWKEEGLIPCASSDGVVWVSYELYSDDCWYSIVGGTDEDWRRRFYIDYSEMVHEITHCITERHTDMTLIMTEGIAQYLMDVVVDDLADEYPCIDMVKSQRYPYDYQLPEAVNGQNAEQIFLNDYSDIPYVERGAEYTYGKYLYMYLHKTYGDDFMDLIMDKIEGKEYSYYNYSISTTQEYINYMKQVYSETIFEDFGNWCVKNGYLQ